jgi:malto-oligosyltrehalose synthase
MRPGTQRLDEQAYLLAHWRDANARVDYRRFFDIPDLVGVRVDDPSVFELTHALILDLVRDGCVQGLRIDHVDGLRDPLGYLRRLREAVGPDVPIWVEKILGPDEQLSPAWPVEGTTGYEVAAAALDALVDPEGLAVLAATYERSIVQRSFREVSNAGKREALVRLLAPDVLRVARALAEPLGREPESLAPELVDAAVALPVYRTYVRPGDVTVADRALLTEAVPDAELRAALLLDLPGASDGALRFQQLTSPAMAKGVEDTALYRHHTLAARNEVGAHPGEPPVGPAAFQAALAARAVAWPAALAALGTHDSKRGPDVRARLLALAELGDDWLAAVGHFEVLELDIRPDGAAEVDANARWLLWQTLVGAWPLDASELPQFADRVREYALKAAREAKERTSWTEPDEAYEHALVDLVTRALDPETALFAALEEVVERIAWPGAVNGLSLALLLLAAPGLPDVYQGTERWSLSLVDPDNRRPVDLAALDRDLSALQDLPASALRAAWRDGRLKQALVARALHARRAHPELFARGSVHLLDAGPDVLAFARELDGRWAICAVPRSPLRRPPSPLALPLPDGAPARWRDVFDGVVLEAPTAFASLPVTLLVGSAAAP